MIYLDYNATTPILPEVLEAMIPYLTSEWGTPPCSYKFGSKLKTLASLRLCVRLFTSSSYKFGSKLKTVIETTRSHVAELIGARASEIASLNLDYFNPQQNTLAILSKGDRFRLIDLEKRTSQLLRLYIEKYRVTPKPLYQQRLFVSQRGEELTRHGLYRLCQKHLTSALPPKRLQDINPVHSFRHSRAMDLLYRGQSITDIKNRLGHGNLQSTMTYLQLNLNRSRHIQSGFIKYMQSVVTDDPKIDELLQWEGNQDTGVAGHPVEPGGKGTGDVTERCIWREKIMLPAPDPSSPKSSISHCQVNRFAISQAAVPIFTLFVGLGQPRDSHGFKTKALSVLLQR
ncbi:MAG: tyrosine-type recombinase/integrase [Thermodesulfobacteriota bacterium]